MFYIQVKMFIYEVLYIISDRSQKDDKDVDR